MVEHLKKEINFTEKEYKGILELKNRLDNLYTRVVNDNEDVLRLDVYYAKSGDKAYLQLFKYVPYVYEPASIVYEVDKESIQQLL